MVSIVIPTYNRARLLERAVRSVLRQTYKDFEIIIVDDNSTDNTQSVVFDLKDERIRYVKHEKNRGGSAARNTGIRIARGFLVTFLDDDDLYKETKIETQLYAIGKFDAILCGYCLDNNRRPKGFKKSVVDLQDMKHGNVLGGGTSSLMIKSSIIKEILFDENLSCKQDWDLLVRILHKYRIKYISDHLVIYNNKDHSRISNRLMNMPVGELELRLLAIEKHREILGPFWFNYRAAKMLLVYFKYRHNKVSHLVYTTRKCGVLPVLTYFYHIMIRKTTDFFR